ncbi:MAG: hypothetical protein ABSG94_00505 [Brevinematales bacterium]|jgi:hypothetical protein
MKIIARYISVFAGLFIIASCSGMPVNRPNTDPAAITRGDTTNSAFLFGTYDYVSRSPSLYGQDLGYLALLVEPVKSDSGENQFYVRMEKDNGFFLLALKSGDYAVSAILLHCMNQNMTIRNIHDFTFSVKNGEIENLGRLSLLLTSDVIGNITVSASSGTNTSSSDISELKKAAEPIGSFEFKVSTNTISVPKAVYISSPSS